MPQLPLFVKSTKPHITVSSSLPILAQNCKNGDSIDAIKDLILTLLLHKCPFCHSMAFLGTQGSQV